jgi:hypothetical protein
MDGGGRMAVTTRWGGHGGGLKSLETVYSLISLLPRVTISTLRALLGLLESYNEHNLTRFAQLLERATFLAAFFCSSGFIYRSNSRIASASRSLGPANEGFEFTLD